MWEGDSPVGLESGFFYASGGSHTYVAKCLIRIHGALRDKVWIIIFNFWVEELEPAQHMKNTEVNFTNEHLDDVGMCVGKSFRFHRA